MQVLDLKFVDSIATIGAEDWNSLVGIENPFTRYEFLWALEKTGCTTQTTGWQPHHVAVYSGRAGAESRQLVAVMPLYQKTNSYGEYVFDWAWASAYQNYGLNYYPKFVSAVPFTPSHGARLFTDNSVRRDDIAKLVFDELKSKLESIKASSWHILFPTEEENKLFEALGIPVRTACQFHWFNRDYSSFDDFLATLNSRKRKNIRRERQKVAERGTRFETLNGDDISPKSWNTFYQFYQSTYMMRGMQGYLSQDFFAELARLMPEQ